MNTLKNKEPKENEIKGSPWTDEEKQKLIELYPTHTNKELEIILNKTDGQLRGMKTRLKLNFKSNYLTDEEKEKIKQFYIDNPETMDLEVFSKKIGRQKTSISRYARKIGLTNRKRPSTEEEKLKNSIKHKELFKGEEGLIRRKEMSNFWKEWHRKYEHPRGMLGKHHSPEYCQEISERIKEKFKNMTTEEKHNFAMHSVEVRKKNGYTKRLENAYSRTKSGYRKDLKQFFRSAWEANIARLFNYYNIKWEFEPKRFYFWGDNLSVQSYLPDFYLSELDLWIEVKGWMDEKSKQRFELFANQYPEENKKLIVIDEKLYYQIEKHININEIVWENYKK